MEDEPRPKPKVAHDIGQMLDTLSIHEFDERIALLRAEIERLEAARSRKQQALAAAGSVFGKVGH